MQGQSSEALWREFFGADFDAITYRLADPLLFERIHRVHTSSLDSGDIDDFLDAGRVQLLSVLADVNRPPQLRLSPGLPPPPALLAVLCGAPSVGRATDRLFFMVQESSKPLGLTLSEAEIEAAGHRVRAWRNTYGSMRRELRVRLASWIAEDLAGLSSTRPPRRGSLFVTPGKTSHPDPEVGLLRESLAEPERRWLFEHPFKAPRHASYYAGSYSLRLDELPEARASLGEFLALEEQLLTAIRQLQDEFEAALSSR